MNVQRLKKFAQLADRIARTGQQFDLFSWGKTGECGTIGCLAGLATLDSWFKAQGLRHTESTRYDGSYSLMPLYRPLGQDYSNSGFDALEKFCEINRFAIGKIFSSTEYKNQNTKPQTVARRIRRFIKTGSFNR